MEGNIGQPEMALSRLRTHSGKSRITDERSTSPDLLQRVVLRCLSCSLESVRPGGEVYKLAAKQARGKWLNFLEQTRDPAYAAMIKLDGARHRHRGSYEL